jgi:L-lactate dehydrogenase complex protein LldG
VSEARAEILARIRGALSTVPAGEQPGDVAVARDYELAGKLERAAVLEQFEERMVDYRATVLSVSAGGVADAIGDVCRDLGLRRLVVPAGLAPDWYPRGEVEILVDKGLSARELDGVDGVLTGCAAAIARTGTLILDGQGVCGRRLLTLVPDTHICVVSADQVVETVPEALARVRPAVEDQRLPITLISGPSASSDIELTRVEGVHGPRNLIVLLLG